MDTISKLVIIHPHPPVDFTYGISCLNELIYFDPDPLVTNIPSIYTWFWDFGDGLTSPAANTAHAYITAGTYIVSLTITDSLGCMNVVTKTITIHGLPTANFNAGSNNCSGSTVTFTDQSTTDYGFVVRWEWDFGDGNTLIVKHPTPPTVTHVYTLANTYQVTLKVIASDSCTSSQTQNIVIHPNPVADFISSNACFGASVDFTDNSQQNGGGSIVQWQWDFGDPASGINNLSGLPGPGHVFTSASSFIVTLVVTTGNGCTDTIQHTVVVKPQPQVNFTTTNNCQNNDVIFTPDPLVMTIANIGTWHWEFGDGITSPLQSPVHQYAVSGNYNVTLTVTDKSGCSNSLVKTVAIVPQPSANFSYSHPACRQSEVEFTNLSLAPLGYIVKCLWNFGDGNSQTVTTIDAVTHIFGNYGTFNVSLTITTGDSCKKTITLPVVIHNNPLANFSYLTSCVNTPVQFHDLSQAGEGSLAGWSWNFGDPPSGANNLAIVPDPTHNFTAPGIFPVVLIVSNSNGCQDTISKQVYVHPLPAVDFTSLPGCMNDSTHFISSVLVSPLAVVSRVWDFGDGFSSPAIDPFHIYISSGSFQVTLTVTDTAGCINSISHTVAIVPPPLSFFQVSAQTCASNAVYFTNLSTTPGGNITSYFWDFGDGSDTLLNAPSTGSISHIYSVAGNFVIKLTVHTSLGCEAVSQRTITISASPLAQFNFDNTCASAAVAFHDLSTPNSGTAIINYLWDFGDPTSGANNNSILQNPQHIYNTAGTYTVLLHIENASGCPDTVTKTVVVLPKPPVDYGWANTCLGTITQFTTNITVTNVGAVSTYDWDFGDGTAHNTSQQNPVHTYSVTGNFTVILIITDTAGCQNAISHLISIKPQPNSLFSMSSGCMGASTFFTDESFSSNGEPITNWHWDFGVAAANNDTSNLQNPSWIYTALQVYNVSLIVTNQSGCTDTTMMSLQVFGTPHAGFTYTAAPCNNGAVYFQDSSYNQQATIVEWNWEFEPNHYSTLQNPVYVYYATDSCYDVRLIAKDVRGCVDTTNKSVCVPASLDFDFAATTTCLHDSTYFTPHLIAPTTDSLVFFNWNFGDPTSGLYNTSTRKLPSHYYSQAGTYTVSLESTDVNICSKKVYQFVTVLPLPVPLFSFSQNICDSIVHFNQSSSGSGSNITQWIWNYGDGKSDTINSPLSGDTTHVYASSGLYAVGLTVTNGKGCVNTLVDSNVLVKPCINADFQLVDTLICQNNMLAFADSSYTGIPATAWYWDFGDGSDTTYSIYTNPVNHVFATSGTFNVKMRISTSVAGRTVSDSLTLVVVVNPTPLPDFTYGVVCDKQAAVFTNMTSGNGTQISNYVWDFGEPTSKPNDTSTFKNPSHLYKAPGTYDIKLVTKNTLNCSDSVQKTLIVYGLPDANFQYTLSCAGDKTSFSDMSVVAIAPLVDWQWTFSNTTGIVGKKDVQNPDFIFTTPGAYIGNLMVTDTNGCIDTINRNLITWNIPTSIYTFADNFNDVQGQLQFTNISIDATKYYWTFGNGDDSYSENPVAFYQNDGSYDITLVTWNDKDCTDTLTMKYVFMVKGLYIPNAFSPNNPKEAVTLLKPVGINLKEYRFEVYDRWGNQLWSSDKLDAAGRPTEGWDGKYNGVLMQEGAYVWKAYGIFKDDSIWSAENIGNNDKMPKFKTGTATLIR